jgi:hypothetical protein
MLDKVLAWLVIVAPFALSAIFILIPAKKENRVVHMRWRIALLVFGLMFSLIAWWQQDRVASEAAKDRASAIRETATETAKETTKNVTEAMSEQYLPLIQSLTAKVGELEGELNDQGKKVDVIGNSNIVTGKKPISVIVENPSPSAQSGDAPLDVRASSMRVEPNRQYGQYAMEFILTTNKVMNGGRATLVCKGIISNGNATIPGASAIMGGGAKSDDHTFDVSIDAPNWAPGFPLVVTLYYDQPTLEPCKIMLR